MKNDEEIIEDLKRATEGLLFMSESDYPFEAVYWRGLPDVSEKYLRSTAGVADDASVEVVGVKDFFSVATSEERWAAQATHDEAEKYRRLVRIIEENLEDPKVYRVGSVNIAVYVVGRSGTGDWLGVSTRVVET